MTKRYFNEYVDTINESEYKLSCIEKQKVLDEAVFKIEAFNNDKDIIYNDTFDCKLIFTDEKEKKKITRKSFLRFKNIAAGILIIFVLSAFIPNTPVNALYQKFFAFIPGIGVVQTAENDNAIISSIAEPIKVIDGGKFLEIKSAYVIKNENNYELNISIITNIGIDENLDLKDKETVLGFFSVETMPHIYLISNDQRVPLENYITGSPSMETRAYKINGGFILPEILKNKNSFQISMDGFKKTATIKLSPIKQGVLPETMGSEIIVDDFIIFADVNRNKDVLSVDLSSVAPKEYKNIRFSLFDFEKELFKNGVFIKDNEGNIYIQNETLKKQNNGGKNTFYFDIPEGVNHLKIVIPQFFYQKDYKSELKMKIPKNNEEVILNKKYNTGDSEIIIQKASMLSKNSEILTDDFKMYDCLKIDFGATQVKDSNERVLQILPIINVPSKIFKFAPTSFSANCDLWPLENQKGYTLIEFDNMSTTNKVLINLDIKFTRIGPFEIEVK